MLALVNFDEEDDTIERGIRQCDRDREIKCRIHVRRKQTLLKKDVRLTTTQSLVERQLETKEDERREGSNNHGEDFKIGGGKEVRKILGGKLKFAKV